MILSIPEILAPPGCLRPLLLAGPLWEVIIIHLLFIQLILTEISPLKVEVIAAAEGLWLGYGYICRWQRSPAPIGSANTKALIRLNDGSGNNLYFERRYFGGSLKITTDAPIPAETWSHIAFSHDIADNTGASTVLYINGISQSCTVVPGIGIVQMQPCCFEIGGRNDVAVGPGYFWSGSMDDMAYYDRVPRRRRD